jgi:hypothetical protein
VKIAPVVFAISTQTWMTNHWMTNHLACVTGSSVVCAISCADALCAISKQQDEVKKYIAKHLRKLNPLELLTEALRHFADNEALAKAASTGIQ